MWKEETKTNKRQCPLSLELKIYEGSSSRTRKSEEKDMWNNWVFSLEYKAEGVIDGNSEGG